MAKHFLLYDSDCGLCTRFKKALDFLDANGNLGFMSIDHAEEIGLLDALPDARRHQSFHLVLPDRRLESGGEALPTMLSLLPSGRLVAKLIVSAPRGRSLLYFLYSTVARLHETGSCKMQSTRSNANVVDDLEIRLASHSMSV